MNILEALKSDHDKARAMLEKLTKAEDFDDRKALLDEIAAEITAHHRAEEAVLYNGLRDDAEARPEVLEGEEEHVVADRLLESLSRSPAKDGDRWAARAKVLKEILEHHLDEEEEDLFETAREKLSAEELESMGQRFLDRKRSYLSH